MSAPASASSSAARAAPAPKRPVGEVAASQEVSAEQPAKRRRRSRVAVEEPEPPAGAEEEEVGGSLPSSLGARTPKQENSEHTPIGLNQDKKSDASSILARLVHHHRCPITQQLLVDPVVAEDGHVYERRALEVWLMTKQTSPTYNKAMGLAIMPAHAVRQTVNELVDGGVLDQETTLNFFMDRSRIRAMRSTMPGPDMSGALSDIECALRMSWTETQRKICDFQKEVLTKLQEFGSLVRRGRELQSEVGAAFGHDFSTWVLQLGDAARAAVTAPVMRECQLTEWKPLPKGARVKVIDDANELHKLCERTPPGAEAKVGWNAEMMGFAGRICIVQRVGDAAHTNYILRRELPPAGRDFSFPYDALFLLSS